MARILLMRHGEVENPRGVLYGRLPHFHLSAEGREQAAAAGGFLAATPFNLVISSSLERAVETAALVVERNAAHPQRATDDRIIESGWGGYEGMDVAEFDSNRELYLQKQLTGEKGLERPPEIAARLRQALEERGRAHPAGTILFVSHADPISFLLSALDGQPWLPSKTRDFPRKCSVVEVDLADGTWRHLFTPIGARF